MILDCDASLLSSWGWIGCEFGVRKVAAKSTLQKSRLHAAGGESNARGLLSLHNPQRPIDTSPPLVFTVLVRLLTPCLAQVPHVGRASRARRSRSAGQFSLSPRGIFEGCFVDVSTTTASRIKRSPQFRLAVRRLWISRSARALKMKTSAVESLIECADLMPSLIPHPIL